jgi:adenine-specific DNA-methyltransferase
MKPPATKRPKKTTKPRQWSYLGNKNKLGEWLWDAAFGELLLNAGSAGVVADLYCGSCSVGRMLAARGVRVLCSDSQYFPTLLARTYLGDLGVDDVQAAADELNAHVDAELGTGHGTNARDKALAAVEAHRTHGNDPVTAPPDDWRAGYVSGMFTPLGGRLYFTEENGRRIDLYREKIEAYRRRSPGTFAALLTALLHAAMVHINCPGHTRVYLKTMRAISGETLRLDIPRLGLDVGAGRLVAATWGSDHMLAGWAAERADVVYVDPPYTPVHYGRYYHVLETIARGDRPESVGTPGVRRDAVTSDWSRRGTAEAALRRVVDAVCDAPGRRASAIVMSYSTDGLIPEARVLGVLRARAKTVDVHRRSHARYINPNRKKFRKGDVEELLFVARDLK